MDGQYLNAEIFTPEVDVKVYPSGAKGNGVKTVTSDGEKIIFTLDDGSTSNIPFPDWWFGTRDEYNSLTESEKNSKSLYFIEEDS